MITPLKVYNSLTRKKEVFEPLNPPFVGLYVCGPTVYSDAHLGHARAAITFDVIYRYLMHLGYKVRYVKNITDVGHLVDEIAGEGEDKIQKKAKLEQLEPMEIVHKYTLTYHCVLEKLNVLPPSIEPRASAHIPEQIKMTEQILEHGFAYVSNGSVYFDIEEYNKKEKYGILSGRVTDDMMAGTRALEGQQEKKGPLDFALWKKATHEHLMKWDSPWGEGFPGWHLECSAMSTKYLGKHFDIHGGGMDLLFPHNECEIAQANASNGTAPAKYWLHNNMVTINGQKMARSLGNFITIEQLFSGAHDMLERKFSPMALRFFVLQAHYRSTLDFSNDALVAANKGYKKLINGLRVAKRLKYQAGNATQAAVNNEIQQMCQQCYEGMNDDFNTAITIAHLFNLLKKINLFYSNSILLQDLEEATLHKLIHTFVSICENILGLVEEKVQNPDGFINAMMEMYGEAKANKEYEKVDKIRLFFKAEGLVIKDSKTGVDWAYEE